MAILSALTLSGCASLIGALPFAYWAEPFQGRVVDQETDKPIKGAIVVAQWSLLQGIHGSGSDRLMVIETVTDAEGRYQIPGWGPKRRPLFRWLDKDDPRLVVFKPGYWNFTPGYWKGAFVVGYVNRPGAWVRKSFWNGKDLPLRPFRMGAEVQGTDASPCTGNCVLTEKEWANQIASAQNDVHWNWGNPAWWGDKVKFWDLQDYLKIQNFVRTTNEECRRLPSDLRIHIRRVPEKYADEVLRGAPLCR